LVAQRKYITTAERANLLVSFLLELALLFLVGFWGFHQGGTLFPGYVLAVVLPVTVIILWGVWAAPKSKQRLKNPARTIFKLTWFFLGATLAYFAGNHNWAIVFAVVVILNAGLAFLLGQDY